MSKIERNYGVELFRVLLVWGICFLHSVSQGIYTMGWLVNSLLFCVDGFVFITGYYGTSFKWSKILKLYGTSIYAGIIVGLVALCCDYIEGNDWVVLFKTIKKSALDLWFFNAYIIVLCFAPIIEKILLKKDRIRVLLPILLLVFVWAFLRELYYLRPFLPKATGIGAYSGLTLLGVYVCGRLTRMFEEKISIKKWQMILLGLGSFVVCMLGFGNYASPFAVLLSMCLFYFFKPRLPGKFVQKTIALLGPSLLAVYLLHSNGIGFSIIKAIERWLCVEGVLGCICCSLLVMTGCLILDIPRRFLVWCLHKPINATLSWIDTKWDVFNNALETHIENRSC